MRTLSIAALQTASVAGDPDATADRLAGQISVARAIAPHVELILLPELHLSAPGQLEGAGYVQRVRDAHDGRARNIELTRRGRAMVRRSRTAR